MNSAFKVGILSLVGCGLLIYLIFVIGDIHLTERGYRFTISFYSVNGLNVGASVSMAGVKIGKVEKIQIDNEMVEVLVYIKDTNIKIRRRSTFTIGTAGLMGEKYIDIVPSRDYTSPYIVDGMRVEGTEPVSMENLFEQGTELLKKLQALTVSANDLIGDPQLKNSTKAIFKNAEEASERVKLMLASIQQRTDSIVENLNQILQQVNDEIAYNKGNIRQTIANLKNFSKKINDIATNNEENISEILGNIKNITEDIESILDELSKENKLTNDIKTAVESIRIAAQNAKEITKQIKEIIEDKDIRGKIKTGLDDAHKIAQAVDKVFLNIKQTKVDFKYLLRYNKDTETFFSDMFVDLWPNENSYYRLGVEDIGGDPLFNLMVAKDAQQYLVKRAGIISSKVGLGIDYRWADDVKFSLDFIDTRDPTLRFTSNYMIREGLNLQLRIDDITDKKDVNFALEYRF